jgi:hypothetical protein
MPLWLQRATEHGDAKTASWPIGSGTDQVGDDHILGSDGVLATKVWRDAEISQVLFSRPDYRKRFL